MAPHHPKKYTRIYQQITLWTSRLSHHRTTSPITSHPSLYKHEPLSGSNWHLFLIFVLPQTTPLRESTYQYLGFRSNLTPSGANFSFDFANVRYFSLRFQSLGCCSDVVIISCKNRKNFALSVDSVPFANKPYETRKTDEG
jgi:hypothetical protein